MKAHQWYNDVWKGLSHQVRDVKSSTPWLAGWMVLFALPGLAQTTVIIDAGANRHPISPFIYGVAHATQAQLTELNSPLNRNGGNAATRYNWQQNASNRGRDWFFESLAHTSEEPGAEVDEFITSTRAGGAQPAVTVPMVGWVARLGANRSRLASFSLLKYGPQTESDRAWFPDAGNGIWLNGEFVVNDPNDASTPVDPPFQQGWIQHLRTTWGTAAQGGVRLFAMDNEPSLWYSNHRDVHPTGATLEEVRDKHVAYASMVKDAEPDALVMGPEEWGWSGYLYSGYDQQYANEREEYTEFPDREAHGDVDYLPWLLTQLRQHEQATGRRLLDIFTVHYYPQGGEFSTNITSAMQLRRNRSTRSLWDPNYVDETWINDKVSLIPRLKGWVQSYYPGTKVGLTEYNWGAEGHINGATAQADVLGIFGREGLDYGIRWETPAATTPTYKAMKLYRNYDGKKSTFGDQSVSCAVPNPDLLSAFAAQRSSDGALTVMVINKASSGSTPVTLQLSRFNAGATTQRWQLTSANTITRLTDLAVSGATVSSTLPGPSITLFVIPVKVATNQPPVARITASPSTGSAPLLVSFNGSASTDADGTIASYVWNFGDGQQGSGATVTHSYAQPGNYTATLTVTDSGGASASSTAAISVTTTTTSLTAPSNLYAVGSGSDVTVRWKDNSTNEEGFILERAEDSWPLEFVEIGRVGANVALYVDSDLPAGDYVYRAKAFLGTSASAYSNQDGADAE
jgi:hypothetical protein